MTPDTMELEQRGAIVIARVASPEVSHGQMQELVSELEQRMRCDNAQHFIFDLEGVAFLASACLGVMVQFLQDIEHMRGRILLANCSDNVLFLFKVTKLDTVFLVCEDLDEALDELRR
jgi:anti-anti-sigma factor